MSGGRRADLVVTGRIATLAGAGGPGWVEALAILDGRVLAAGPAAEIDALAGPGTRRIDLGPDEVAIPGLTDAHLHLVEASLARARVDLHVAETISQAQAAVWMAVEGDHDPDRWIEGAGWDADRLGRWPTAD